MFRTTTFMRVLALAGLLAIAVAFAACGDSEDQNQSGNNADAMFVNGMIPHHQGAIEMAELAKTKAKHQEVKELADNIISSQSAEIKQMNAMKSDLPSTSASAMSESMMESMNGDVEQLRDAKNFDQEFLLAMIPHHEMAVMMADSVKENGTSDEVSTLANGIITAQKKEIAEMRSWLKDWYGVTAPESSTESMGQMDHSHMQ